MNKRTRVLAVAVAVCLAALTFLSMISFTNILQGWFASLTPQQQYWLPRGLLLASSCIVALAAVLHRRRNGTSEA
jgi:hypothetical protein